MHQITVKVDRSSRIVHEQVRDSLSLHRCKQRCPGLALGWILFVRKADLQRANQTFDGHKPSCVACSDRISRLCRMMVHGVFSLCIAASYARSRRSSLGLQRFPLYIKDIRQKVP